MVTTFDAARWAVRAILIASIVGAVLNLSSMVFPLVLPVLPGVSNSTLAVTSLFSIVPALVTYGALYFFSDPIARQVAGGAESVRHPLNQTRQFYPLALSLIGFLVALPGLPTFLWISVWISWTLVQSSFDWSRLSPTSASVGTAILARSLLAQFGAAVVHLFVGVLLMSWRRLAPKGADASS